VFWLGYYLRLAEPLFKKNLVMLIFFVTSRCNSKCKMCFYWRQRSREDELTLQEIEEITQKTPNFTHLMISGGEPYLRKDLPEIVQSFTNNNDIKFLTIPTNATLPRIVYDQTRKILETCDLKHFNVALAVDGIKEKHDEIRGFPENFKLMQQTYKYLCLLRKEFPNFAISTVTTCSIYNQKELLNIYRYVKRFLRIDNFVINLCRGKPREPEAKNVDIRYYEDLINVLDKEIMNGLWRYSFRGAGLWKRKDVLQHRLILRTFRERRRIIPCYAGRLGLVLNEIGDVFPCELLAEAFGNVRHFDYEIKKILSQEHVKNVCRWITESCFCTHECWFGLNLLHNPKEFLKVLVSKR